MWALAFFMAFNRTASFRPGFVSETLSVRTFHFVEQNLTNYYEMMLTDRKEAASWARRSVGRPLGITVDTLPPGSLTTTIVHSLFPVSRLRQSG